ncbi:phosphoribosyltransferase [Caulobacter vibrioides]|uniref:phosphoribosyltransferase n=1 Tax=Caulobacter vibrioides TaxID=155892 RepID=UPI000F746383|nr:phosphoribosyltransferase [Caulobacter vibrioides]
MSELVSLRLQGLCGYPSWDAGQTPFRKIDWISRYLVKAIKGDLEALRKSFVVLGKPQKKFNHENYGELVEAFHRWSAERLKELEIDQPVLVAIPNSAATSAVNDFGTKRLAEGIAAAFGPAAKAYTDLRFSEVLAKSHKGGGRSKTELLNKMVLNAPVPDGTVVLIDDVCSSGSHLFAAQRKLRPRAAELALVCGRTVNEPRDKMLNIPIETITSFW